MLFPPMTRDIGVLLRGCVVVALLGGCGLMLYGCLSMVEKDAAEYKAQKARWANATVVRICHDGTRIYQLQDGTYWSGSWSQVSGPEVCR